MKKLVLLLAVAFSVSMFSCTKAADENKENKEGEATQTEAPAAEAAAPAEEVAPAAEGEAAPAAEEAPAAETPAENA